MNTDSRADNYNRIERNTVRTKTDNDQLKNEVYAIVGVAGSLLIVTIFISILIVKRYRRKLLENSDSTTFKRNNLDLR